MRFTLRQLLYTEARLLDLTQYEAWLEMLAMRVRYWSPVRINAAQEDFENPNLLTLFDDRRPDLVLRVKRIRTGYALSEQPASRVRRLITNLIVTEEGEKSAHVESTFLVTTSRWNTPTRVFSGHRTDRWVRGPEGAWLLEDRRVVFDVSTTQNISFIV